MRGVLRGAALAAAIIVIGVLDATSAMATNGALCPDLATGRLVATPGLASVSVHAPEGMLVDHYCVVSQSDLRMTIVDLEQPASAVTIETPDGSDIVEYAASFVSLPPQAEEPPAPDTATAPQSATVPPPAKHPTPGKAAAGDGSSLPAVPALAWVGLLLGLVGVGSASLRSRQ